MTSAGKLELIVNVALLPGSKNSPLVLHLRSVTLSEREWTEMGVRGLARLVSLPVI